MLNIKNYNESILKSTTNGLITLDTDRNVVTVNETACRLLRATPEALIGASAAATFTGANAWIVDSIARVEASGKEDIAVDADLALAGGEKVSMNLVVVPLIDVAGENIGAMLIVEDITSEMRVKTTMSRYMSKEIADQLLAGGEDELGGRSQVATVLFSDIRRFTTITEALGPRETVTFLNDYLSEMVDVVLRHGGILDKYIGDSVMALFGAPLPGATDADNAVTVGCEMRVALDAMNARRRRKKLPPIKIGVGISTGTVIAGSIGSSKRMEYTVIGDSVNLAARLESANKFYSTQVLVSEHTVRALKRDTPLREIDLHSGQGQGRAGCGLRGAGLPHRQDLSAAATDAEGVRARAEVVPRPRLAWRHGPFRARPVDPAERWAVAHPPATVRRLPGEPAARALGRRLGHGG